MKVKVQNSSQNMFSRVAFKVSVIIINTLSTLANDPLEQDFLHRSPTQTKLKINKLFEALLEFSTTIQFLL